MQPGWQKHAFKIRLGKPIEKKTPKGRSSRKWKENI